MQAHELAEQWDDAEPPVRLCRADAQAAARRTLIGDDLFGVAQIGQDTARGAQIGLALGGQRQAARRAQKQAHAQPRLYPVDRAAHRRRSQAKAAPGRRKAALGNRRCEHLHRPCAVAAIVHLCVHFKNLSLFATLLCAELRVHLCV